MPFKDPPRGPEKSVQESVEWKAAQYSWAFVEPKHAEIINVAGEQVGGANKATRGEGRPDIGAQGFGLEDAEGCEWT